MIESLALLGSLRNLALGVQVALQLTNCSGKAKRSSSESHSKLFVFFPIAKLGSRVEPEILKSSEKASGSENVSRAGSEKEVGRLKDSFRATGMD